ncbi:MAG: restriction endonuclease subunit S [Phascolarctobacterium sp.]|nr:restriction endonuclease subunit S [Phascolarctobacterium sp.]
MSKPEELINKLCPDGVEYKTLEEIANYRRGSFPQPYGNSEWYGGEGEKPFVQVADMKDDEFNLADTTKQTISIKAQPKSVFVPKGTVLVSLQGTIGRVAITQYDSYVDRTIGIFTNFLCEINTRYFAYQLAAKFNYEKQYARGSTLKTITKEEFSKFAIPLPPLPVQEEIVRILDNMTSLTAELTAELKARQKQYEYYRESLLSFDEDNAQDGVRWMKLGELFPSIRNGFVGTVTPYFTDADNGVRYLKGTNIHNGVISDNDVEYVTRAFHQKHIKTELKADDILMVQSGHVGECAVVGEKYAGANCHALIVLSNGGECLSQYIAYYLQSKQGKKKLKAITTGGTVKHILASAMKKFEVPVPTLEEQQRIVDILDRFDKLCNDISEGLPAEIEARKKQYEYYRDKLLTFKEKEA